MNLTKEKLESLFNKKYEKQNDIAKRFKEIGEIVDKFLSLEIDKKYIKEFGPLRDGLLGGNGDENRNKMQKEGIPLIDKLWFLIGGYDGKRVQAKYRIISASKGSKENYFENEDYSTYHSSLWANSNFVTNNYPHQIAKFLQDPKEDKKFSELIDNSKIVLTWITPTYLGSEIKQDDNDKNNISKAFEASTTRLETRFPPKFLWMWANRDKVIHPISLMAFRNFLNTDYGKEILENIKQKSPDLKDIKKDELPKKITNMKFDDFKEVWKKISDKILEEFSIDNNKDNIEKLSLLISQVCIEETDIKNVSDLLQTGNKAVILWGPPGTGKTYESMEVVKELLEIDDLKDDKIEEEYLFSKNEKDLSKNDKGYYEIIQFHPNYTYQDFIGGIAPKIDGSSISYELREGIFKRFCDEANKNKDKKFIFIIDEINRAELSAVFGELLFALEYRNKPINLPYFEEFTIPDNVYIIGTMNNVDKSLVTFDLALRRRFGFFKLMPKLEVINEVLSEIVEEESVKSYYNKCVKLNESISELDLGEDYQIGQAYFLKIKDFLDQNNIQNNELQPITSFEREKLWVYNIEPLLEEYLGMSMEDVSIKKKLKKIKEEFLDN